MTVLLLAIVLANTLGYVGVVASSIVLKVTYVVLQVVIVVYSSILVYINRRVLHQPLSLFVIIAIFAYPQFSIIYSLATEPTMKNFTDLFFGEGVYYYSIFVGFALAVLSSQGNVGVISLKNAVMLVFPFAILTILFLCRKESLYSIGFAHLAIDNVFLPGSLLILKPRSKYCFLVGVACVLSIFYTSATIWSRSYFLIGLYVSAFWFVVHIARARPSQSWITGLLLVAFTIPVAMLSLYSVASSNSVVQEKSLIDKLDLSGMIAVGNKCILKGSLKPIKEWGGNSRTGVLEDAFEDFNDVDWLLGKGPLAVYESFVTRKTIEIGFAQEIFRWGLIYVIPNICLTIYILYALLRNSKRFDVGTSSMLGLIVLIRILDMAVFGVPKASLYTTLVAWGIASVCCVNKSIQLLPCKPAEVTAPE